MRSVARHERGRRRPRGPSPTRHWPRRVGARHRPPSPRPCTRSGLSLEERDPTAAAEHLQRAADIAAGAGNRWVQAFALTEVLSLEARHGSSRSALARFADVIDMWFRGGDWANQWLSLRHVFGILVQLDDNVAAATLHGALTAIGAAYALPFEASDAERIDTLVDELREEMRPGEFATAVRRGASMTDGEIVEFVQSRIRVLTRGRQSWRTRTPVCRLRR